MKRCILCLAALLLAACGASGALYLPDHPRPKHSLAGKEQRKNDAAPAAAAPAAPEPASAAPAAADPAAPPAAAPDSATSPTTTPQP